MNDALYSFMLTLPVLIVFIAVACYPLVQTIVSSFFMDRPTQPWLGNQFVGLDNYRTLLKDSVFWQSIGNTLRFTVVTVSAELVIGMLAALMLNRRFVGQGAIRVAVMIPWAIPTVIAGSAFLFMYNDVYGVLNDLLMRTGILQTRVAWLAKASTAMGCVMVADIWKTFPFITIILLANLQAIPLELYESAKIDGANGLHSFRYITLPSLRSAIFVALLFRTIDALRVFDMIIVLTNGGPADSTNVILTNVYRYTFRYMKFDVGAAASVISFMIIFCIAMLYVLALSWQQKHE